MFRRKRKTPIEQARDKIINFGHQADDARKDAAKQLKQSVRHLRDDVQELLEDGDERATRLAKELEHVARDLEKRSERRLGEVGEVASDNVWYTIMIAFGIGLLIGLLLRVLNR